MVLVTCHPAGVQEGLLHRVLYTYRTAGAKIRDLKASGGDRCIDPEQPQKVKPRRGDRCIADTARQKLKPRRGDRCIAGA